MITFIFSFMKMVNRYFKSDGLFIIDAYVAIAPKVFITEIRSLCTHEQINDVVI